MEHKVERKTEGAKPVNRQQSPVNTIISVNLGVLSGYFLSIICKIGVIRDCFLKKRTQSLHLLNVHKPFNKKWIQKNPFCKSPKRKRRDGTPCGFVRTELSHRVASAGTLLSAFCFYLQTEIPAI
jgi:hypothetical protein